MSADNIVLAQIAAGLDFDQFQEDLAWIFQPVDGNKCNEVGMEAEFRGYLPAYRIGFVLPKLTRRSRMRITAFGTHKLLSTIFSQQW
jgi:hypothetical protein